MVKLPNGLSTKQNISKLWPERIVGDHVFPNKKSFKFYRNVKSEDGEND